MVPDIGRWEWIDLINGILNSKVTNLLLKLKLNELKIKIMLHHINLNEGVTELHRFVAENEQKFQKELQEIFNLH